jgi:hypothetical protein
MLAKSLQRQTAGLAGQSLRDSSFTAIGGFLRAVALLSRHSFAIGDN